MEQIIITVIELVVLIGSFLIGKYVLPKISSTDIAKMTLAVNWAKKFVTTAKNILGEEASGEEKLTYVTEQLSTLVKDKGINLSAEQIRALIEDAYNEMKKGEESNIKEQ